MRATVQSVRRRRTGSDLADFEKEGNTVIDITDRDFDEEVLEGEFRLAKPIYPSNNAIEPYMRLRLGANIQSVILLRRFITKNGFIRCWATAHRMNKGAKCNIKI